MNRFCSKCGEKMNVEKLPASTYSYLVVIFNDTHQVHPYSDFNSKTGKPQWVNSYSCPNEKWYNFHDSYVVDKLIT